MNVWRALATLWAEDDDRDKITTWQLQAIHEQIQAEDRAQRHANRLYVAHLDEIGASEAWRAAAEAHHRIVRLNARAS